MNTLPLDQLPHLAFAFMLLLARFGGLVTLVPALGETQIPVALRAALAVVLSVLLLPLLWGHLPPNPDTPWALAGLMASETVTGLWFGWCARLVALALTSSAQFISFMIGLSSVLVPDFSGSQQTGALGRVLGIVPPLLLLSSGLYRLPLEALVSSYHLIPAGTLLPAGDAVSVALHGVAASFDLALRLSAPFIIAGTVWQIGLGIVARLAPSVQVYLLAMPGQVVGGLLLLAVTAPTLLTAWLLAARSSLVPLTGG